MTDIPKGWMLVPIKITHDMADAAMVGHYGKARAERSGMAAGIVMTVNDLDYSGIQAMRRLWKGALSAVPAVPTQGADARIATLEAENEALRHDIERHIANHAADLNAIVSGQEKFETWAKSEEYDLRPSLYDKDRAYVSPMTNAIWIGWQAARAPTQGADARPVAIYQVRDHEEHDLWRDVDEVVYGGLIDEMRRIVYATRDAAPSDVRVAILEEAALACRARITGTRRTADAEAAACMNAIRAMYLPPEPPKKAEDWS